jgi:hypothetical protein
VRLVYRIRDTVQSRLTDKTSDLAGDGVREGAERRSVLDPQTSLRQAVGPDLGLLTAFWTFVALTNVLWGTSMRASLAAIGVTHVFAPWNTRLVQYLILYPALIGCMWISRRVGWRPFWRAIPLQLTCGLAFSALANPVMNVAEWFVGMPSWQRMGLSALLKIGDDYPGQQAFLWVASVSSFLINYVFCLAFLGGVEFYRRYRDSQVRSEALERSLNAALSRLNDELDFVRLYLELQQRRFADRLIVIVPDPEMSPDVCVPTLILQPLVENAVVHGLADPQATVIIRVEVVADSETLILRVVNSLTSKAADANTEQPGIGLKNVRERLAVQFGGRAAFRSGPGHDSDWVAEIRLPMLHNGA